MNLLAINPEDPANHFLLYRGFNTIREFEQCSVEDLLTFSYFESLLFSGNPSNLIFLKTALILHKQKFPKLLNFIYQNPSAVFIKNFFASKEFLELKNEILKFAKRFAGRNLKDLKNFSREFNVAITFFDNQQIFDIYEGLFIDPIQVALLKVGSKVYIIYRSEDSESSLKVPGYENRILFELFNEYGMYFRQKAEGRLSEEKELMNYQALLLKMRETKEVNWKFIN